MSLEPLFCQVTCLDESPLVETVLQQCCNFSPISRLETYVLAELFKLEFHLCVASLKTAQQSGAEGSVKGSGEQARIGQARVGSAHRGLAAPGGVGSSDVQLLPG